ncbi:MAG: Nif3-like dinuclear metal center hexameric protein [Bacteroidales bacterium]|nr:Nif3-like dinuclear metal center hexameric protein [Bacteroidales bacterium]
MRVRDVTAALEAFAPLSLQEKWDNSGLSVGSPDQEVHGILLALDCTPALVDEAAACGADLIVTHHPLIFGGLRQVAPEDPVGLSVIKAVRAGIAVYAAHTTADKVPAGVSGAMARRLGLQNLSVLDPEGTRFLSGSEQAVGLGIVGDLPEPLDCAAALDRVKAAFGLRLVRCSHFIDAPIRRVAVCGGSGSSLIEAARKAGAQLYLSGDISYHHFFTPEDFVLMDIGHFESEVEIVDILYSLLKKNFPNFAVRISKTLRDSNPIQYL